MTLNKNGNPARHRQSADWLTAKTLWRIGKDSYEVITKKCNIRSVNTLTAYAADHGWVRGDLAERFELTVQKKLMEDYLPSKDLSRANYLVSPSSNLYETAQEVMLNNAAEAAVSVVREHRQDLKRLRKIANMLTDRLEAHMEGRPIMITDSKTLDEREAPCMSAKESPAVLLETISRVQYRIQMLERTAFGLNAKDSDKPGIPIQHIGPDDRDI